MAGAVKPEDLQKAVLVALDQVNQELQKLCKEVEGMRVFDDIKEKEPQTRMILELQKCLAMYPKGPQQYAAPKYDEITDERLRNYKKILHQTQWEVQSKLLVIKAYAGKPLPMDKIVNLARSAKEMQSALGIANKKPAPASPAVDRRAAQEEEERKKKDAEKRERERAEEEDRRKREEEERRRRETDTMVLPPAKKGQTFSVQVVENFKTDESWSVDLKDLELERQIGQGSFGKVYQGSYFGTKVAIKKIIVKDEREMVLIKREVDMLKDVRHPNIVSFYGICKQDDALLLVQEFVSCGELYKLLKDEKVEIDWKLCFSISKDTAAGMAYLHSRGVIHRDLKSENLLVDEHWRIKICDFGLARIPRKSTRPMTHKIGTPFFMAPEVIQGKSYDEKADVFSFGIVLLEVVTRCKGPPDIMERGQNEGYAVNYDRLLPFVPKDCPPELFKLAKETCHVQSPQRPSFKAIVERIRGLQDRYSTV
jgi:tRNA A-37 threonylcarbamoyl transferase component Bud32